MKVPNVQFDIVDIYNNKINGEVYCLNKTNADDCDLYFIDIMKAFSLNHYKLVPTSQATATLYVKKTKIPVFFISKTY